jgi:hypothetical protein
VPFNGRVAAIGDAAELERKYRLAYEEGVRALSQQQAVVDGYRTRAGVTLSATAVATSFFGSQALTGSGLDTWSWIAIVVFVGVGVTLLAVMTPGRLRNLLGPGQAREGLAGFVASPVILIEGYFESDPPRTLAQTYRDVALHMEAHWERNEAVLVRRIDQRFRLASVLLIGEIAAWVIDLA